MKKIKASTLRTLTILAFVLLVIIGLAFHTGTGTLSAFGYKTFSAICPLGSLEAQLASKTFLPHILISLAVFVLITILLGRIFCAWACPVPLFRKWFPKNNPTINHVEKEIHASSEKTTQTVDSGYFVLGGALASSFIFGFPVFCLICPVGLTFAVLIGVWRLIQFNEPTWSLLAFPLILIVELALYRYSCRKFCPLGALISLVSRLNIFARPKIDQTKCMQTSKGVECKLCKSVCNEAIDLHETVHTSTLSRCTKCRDCADVCPMSAIKFPFLSQKNNKHI
jgi:ferredoxin-type protein NapH